VENSFKNLVDSATSLLILVPVNPLLDEVSSSLALYLGLKKYFVANTQKGLAVSCPTQMTVDFSRLVGVDKISTQLGNKNLLITFSNYPANDIEKVSYDIEEGKFKLSIIPKAGLNAPLKEQIVMDYEGLSADLVVLVGGDKEEDFPALSLPELKGIRIAHLGTKLLESSNQSPILSFARPSSSISELVFSLFAEMQIEADVDIATNLLAGIEIGSQHFLVPETNIQTFEVFANLLKIGGQRFKKIQPSSFPQGAIPQQPYNQSVPKATTQVVQAQNVQTSNVPQSWTEPKVYTGTSVS